MAEFDPDQYLSDFDPDAFLKGSPPQEEGGPSLGEDLVKSGGIGLAKGLTQGIGATGNLREGVKAVGDAIGLSPENKALAGRFMRGALGPLGPIVAAAPSGADVQKKAEEYTGEFYKPKTKLGEYAESAGQFMGDPTSYVGPGGLLTKGLVAGAAGLGTQGGRDLVEEEGAKKEISGIIGSLVGSLGVAGASALLRNVAGIAGLRQPQIRAPGEFDFATTRGVLSGDTRQLGLEEQLASGSKGPSAQRIMEQNRLQREADIQAGQENIRAGLGGQETTAAEAGETVAQGLRERAAQLRSAGDRLYEGAWAQSAVGHNVRPTQPLLQALAREGVPDPTRLGGYPGAERAMNIVQNLERMHPGAPAPFTIAMNDVHEVAKQLRSLKPSSAGDAQLIGVIRKSFDDYETGLVNNAMFQGDLQAGLDRRLAKDVWRRYRQMVDKDPKKDYTTLLSDIANKDMTGEQVGNFLLNATNANQASRASRFVRYLDRTFGRQSEEIQSLRQAMWSKVSGLNETNANNIPAILASRGKIAKDIESFVEGRGAPLARALYSDAERARMTRFVEALRSTNPKPSQTPGTAPFLLRYAWPMTTGLLAAGAYGGASAHEGGLWGWRQATAAALVPFIRNGLAARRALQATTQVRPQSMTLNALRPATAGALHTEEE